MRDLPIVNLAWSEGTSRRHRSVTCNRAVCAASALLRLRPRTTTFATVTIMAKVTAAYAM